MGGAGLIDRSTTIVEDIKRLFFSTTVSEDVYTGKNRYVPAKVEQVSIEPQSVTSIIYTRIELRSSKFTSWDNYSIFLVILKVSLCQI